jgi:hypothetical protein
MPKLVISLPPSTLRVNATKGHAWQRSRQAAIDYRQIVGSEVLVQESQWKGVAVTYPVPVTVWVCITGERTADTVDASSWLKSAWDELVAMAVFPDDSDKVINPVTIGIERVKRNPRVEIYWPDATGKV